MNPNIIVIDYQSNLFRWHHRLDKEYVRSGKEEAHLAATHELYQMVRDIKIGGFNLTK